MTTKASDNREPNQGERLEYEPPCVFSEETFETLALSCSKIGDDALCEATGIVSS